MPTKILLIEDDPLILKMYETKFALEKLEVRIADDGRKGFEALEEFHPDIVLLDLMMPELDGFEVLTKVRSDPKWANLPVIVLSNISQEIDRQRALDLGASDYFIKTSLTPQQVVDRIKAVLKESAKQQ